MILKYLPAMLEDEKEVWTWLKALVRVGLSWCVLLPTSCSILCIGRGLWLLLLLGAPENRANGLGKGAGSKSLNSS